MDTSREKRGRGCDCLSERWWPLREFFIFGNELRARLVSLRYVTNQPEHHGWGDLGCFDGLFLAASGVNLRLSDNTVGQESPLYSPNGDFLFMPNATGITRFPVNADGSLSAGTKISIPTVNGRQALTAGMAYSPDGSTLYAAVNGQNRVVAIDPTAGTIKQSWDVGIAPRQLKFVGGQLYVSDEGGRMAKPGEDTIESYGTQV